MWQADGILCPRRAPRRLWWFTVDNVILPMVCEVLLYFSPALKKIMWKFFCVGKCDRSWPHLYWCSVVTKEENGAKLFKENLALSNSENWVAGEKKGQFQRSVWNVKVVCWNLYLEVEFFGPGFAVLAQSCSFQVCVFIYCDASAAAQHTAVMRENPSTGSICQQGWIKGRFCWLRVDHSLAP